MANTYFELGSEDEDGGNISITACIRRNRKRSIQIYVDCNANYVTQGEAYIYLDKTETKKLIKALKQRKKVSAMD